MQFDKDGWLNLGGNHGAEKQKNGLIRVVESGSTLFTLPDTFPPERLRDALLVYHAGIDVGTKIGRARTQDEIKRALGLG